MSKKGKTAGLIIGGLAVGAIAAVTAAATIHDLKQEKRARRELHKHKDLVEQKKQYVEHGNIKHYNPIVQTHVSLLGFFNKYLSGFKNGKVELKQDKIGTNEMFMSVPVTKDIVMQKDYRCKVGLQLNGTDLCLRCEKNGSLSLRQSRLNGDSWETWIVEKDDKSGMFSFKSQHGTYLCAQKGKPNANRKKKEDWEKWRVIVVQDAPQKQTEKASKQQVSMVKNEGSYYDQPKTQSMEVNAMTSLHKISCFVLFRYIHIIFAIPLYPIDFDVSYCEFYYDINDETNVGSNYICPKNPCECSNYPSNATSWTYTPWPLSFYSWLDFIVELRQETGSTMNSYYRVTQITFEWVSMLGIVPLYADSKNTFIELYDVNTAQWLDVRYLQVIGEKSTSTGIDTGAWPNIRNLTNLLHFHIEWNVDPSSSSSVEDFVYPMNLDIWGFADYPNNTIAPYLTETSDPPSPYSSTYSSTFNHSVTPTNPTFIPTQSPTKQPTVNAFDICDEIKYAGALSVWIVIDQSQNVTQNVYPNSLLNVFDDCNVQDIEGEFRLNMDDISVIGCNEYFVLYWCIENENDIHSVNWTIRSDEFSECIHYGLKNSAELIFEHAEISLREIHELFEFLISDFMTFVITFSVVSILVLLAILNWFHSMISYYLCGQCICCCCMAADEADVAILFKVTIRVADFITDTILAINIYDYYYKYHRNDYYVLALVVVNVSTLILPYCIINICSMLSASRLNTKTDRFKQWFRTYRYPILFNMIFTGDSYVSLLLFTSNMFGLNLFDSGLSSYHLKRLRKFEIAMIVCENIPQMITQLIFAYITGAFAVVALSLSLSICLDFISIMDWFMNQNFDKDTEVCDYYIECKLNTKQHTFNKDFNRIKRLSKCRSTLRKQLENAIKENVSKIECHIYYIEMIGTGCNIHIIHYLTGNTKIRTDAGSIRASHMKQNTSIIQNIYEGKLDIIEDELTKFWSLEGAMEVTLHDDVDLSDARVAQMILHRAVHTQTQSDISYKVNDT